jgi:hypothetical protein
VQIPKNYNRNQTTHHLSESKNPPMDNKQSKLATQLFNSNGQTIQQELNKKIFTIQEESPRSEAYEKEFSEASTDALTTVR